MAGGSRHRRAQCHGWFRCPVDQLRLARNCEGLGGGQGNARLGSVDGIGGHGIGLRAARRSGRQDWAAPDHPRLSRCHDRRHVRRESGRRRPDAARLAVADRSWDRRHAGVDQCSRCGVIQPALAERGRVPDGDRLSDRRSDRRYGRAEIAGRRYLARCLHLRRLGHRGLHPHRVVPAARIRGLPGSPAQAGRTGGHQSDPEALWTRVDGRADPGHGRNPRGAR